jgi:hypothetical protein
MVRAPSVSIVGISPLQLFAMITVMQAGIHQQPKMADDNWARIGITAARVLQEDLFKQYPETYKVLEFGWNPGAYLVTPETIAEMLLDIDSRRSEKNISDKDGETGSDETLSQQIARSILKSQGCGPGLELDM